MKRSRAKMARLLLVLAGIILAAPASTALAPTAHAKGGQEAGPGSDSTADAQVCLQPLRELADALGSVGRSAYGNSFTDVHINAGAGTVTLYATSADAGSSIVAAAEDAHPALEWTRVTVAISAYSRHALDAAADALMSDPANAAIVSATPAGDGSGIDVVVDSSSAVQPLESRARKAAATSGIPLHVTVGTTIQPSLWRWNDAKPLIGGVEGVKSVHAVEHGDSGGLVFTVSSSTTRQARGSVSAQSGSGKSSTTMYWTEAPDILSFFPVHLNPHT